MCSSDLDRLVGSSGSFDTLRAMHFRDGIGESNQSLHADLPLDGFQTIHQWLIRSALADRLKHPAIPSIRALVNLVSYAIRPAKISACEVNAIRAAALVKHPFRIA